MNTAILFVARQALLVTGLALKTSKAQRAVVAATIVGVDLYAIFWNTIRTPVRAIDFLVPSSWIGSTFLAIDLLVLSDDPLSNLRRRTQSFAASSLGLLPRVSWATTLISSPRGIGWNHQVAHVPVFTAPRTRGAFVWSRVVSNLLNIILLVSMWISVMYARLKLAGSIDDVVAKAQAQAEHPEQESIFRRPYVAFMWIFTSFFLVNIAYQSLAFWAVALKISVPEAWPQAFGGIRDAYTMRRVWGRVWHQFLRKLFTAFGDFFAQDVFRVQRGTISSTYIKLYTAFILSAVIHSVGDYGLTGGELWFSWKFFLLQAVAITAEDVVIAIAKALNFGQDPRIAKSIGYIWVILWSSATVPILANGFTQAWHIRLAQAIAKL